MHDILVAYKSAYSMQLWAHAAKKKKKNKKKQTKVKQYTSSWTKNVKLNPTFAFIL